VRAAETLTFDGGIPVTDSERFVAALERGDLDAIRTVPKGDLHNHSWLGERRSTIERRTGLRIPPPPSAFSDLDHLFGWCIGVFLPAVRTTPEGRVNALEAAFVQAAEDGVTDLAMSFGALMRDAVFGGSLQREITTLKRLHETFAPDTRLRPVLGLNRKTDPEEMLRLLDDHVGSGFYAAVDLYGDEAQRSFRDFGRVFQCARSYGLCLTAHAGEFGDAESVKQAVVELELDQVQHGIGAAGSPRVMRFLVDHCIQLNVCPTSNVRMGRALDYETHPIRRLYDHGVRVTVNTDDVTVFDQGVSQEFLNLYRAGNWTAKELDEIRRNGISSIP
jgi:adenosine deaminase